MNVRVVYIYLIHDFSREWTIVVVFVVVVNKELNIV